MSSGQAHRWRLPAAASILVALLLVPLIINPLRRPTSLIEHQLLSRAPLGTHIDSIDALLVERGWELAARSDDVGFYDQRTSPAGVVGSQHIRAELGHYRGLPFDVYVTVFWGFDMEGRLIDVWVSKTADGI